MPDHLIEMEKDLLEQYKISSEEEKQLIENLITDKEHLLQEIEKTRTKLVDLTKLLFNI